jgi:hypothetical protein
MPEDDDRPEQEVLRRKIATGVLPAEVPSKVWVGRGTDDTCIVCDQQISPDDIECEVDIPDARAVRLHLRCHTLWVAKK